MSEAGVEEKIKLYGNPKLQAMELYKFLRKQPFEVRKNLQTIIDSLPLTKSLKEDYFLDDSGD